MSSGKSKKSSVRKLKRKIKKTRMKKLSRSSSKKKRRKKMRAMTPMTSDSWRSTAWAETTTRRLKPPCPFRATLRMKRT